MSKSGKKVVIKGKVDAQEWISKNNGYPEVGTFSEQKDLQKFYKQLDDEQIFEWVTTEGLEFKPCDNQMINRMRMAMAILYKHFPKEAPAKKEESPYKKYDTETLIQMCIDNSVCIEVTEDMRIMRMRAIMSLRAAKIIE
jgi:hypothetical protein